MTTSKYTHCCIILFLSLVGVECRSTPAESELGHSVANKVMQVERADLLPPAENWLVTSEGRYDGAHLVPTVSGSIPGHLEMNITQKGYTQSVLDLVIDTDRQGVAHGTATWTMLIDDGLGDPVEQNLWGVVRYTVLESPARMLIVDCTLVACDGQIPAIVRGRCIAAMSDR